MSIEVEVKTPAVDLDLKPATVTYELGRATMRDIAMAYVRGGDAHVFEALLTTPMIRQGCNDQVAVEDIEIDEDELEQERVPDDVARVLYRCGEVPASSIGGMTVGELFDVIRRLEP